MRKIAIIEIASSHIKLTMAKINGGFYQVFDEISDSIKLGEDINKDGFLKPNRISEVMTILKGYKKLCTASGVEDITAITTFAVRNAKNQKSFVDEISAIIGIKVRVLTEEEEINAIYTGVINTLEAPKGVIVNIGAESTELCVYIRRNIIYQKVLPFGAVTLSNKFENENAQLATQQSYDFFKKLIGEISEIKNLEEEFQIVGVGFAFGSLGKISRMSKKYPLDLTHGYVLGKKDVEQVYNFVKGLDIDKKKKLRGISEDRADIVAISLAMAKAACDYVNLDNIIISNSTITTGLLLNEANAATLEKPITDILGFSLENQAMFHEASRTNGEQVYNLSMLLFKQLRVLHKLSRTYIKSLRVASYMHDAGLRINFTAHTKNCFQVILNENIYGLSHRELLVAAFIASAQDATDLSLVDIARYREIITEEDLDAIRKLAVIVRIAEALDRCGTAIIKDINCDILGDSVILKAVTEVDATFEIKEAMTAQGDFFRAYKKNIEIL